MHGFDLVLGRRVGKAKRAHVFLSSVRAAETNGGLGASRLSPPYGKPRTEAYFTPNNFCAFRKLIFSRISFDISMPCSTAMVERM